MKVKRYSNLSRRGPSVWKIAVGIIAVALLVFLGFSLAEPIAKLFSGAYRHPAESSQASEDASKTLSEVVSDNTGATSSSPEILHETEGISVTVPVEVLKTKASEFFESAKAQGVNDVIVELKDKNGLLHYQSALASAMKAKAVAEDALDLALLVKECHDRGMTLTVKIHCFMDHTATALKGAAVRYRTADGALWLDDYKDRGGKSWLNPYSQEAKTYLTDIVHELTEQGADRVILASVRFPGGYQQDAYYGEDTQSRTECLKSFVAQAKEATAREVWLEVGVWHYAAKSPEVFGDNALQFGADGIFANLVAEDFGKTYTVGDRTVNAPSEHPTELIDAVMETLKTMNTEKIKIIPSLQGYSYTPSQIKEQIEETKKYGAEHWALKLTGETVPEIG